MKRKLILLSLVLLLICKNSFSETITVNSSQCLYMGETKVHVEMTKVQIIQNEWYNRKGEVISPAKVLAESESSMFVLVCDWYENYSDYSFSDSTSLFFIKYLPVNDSQFHFDNLAYSIKYDTVKIIEYENFTEDFSKYGKKATKSKSQKIYNPETDKLNRIE